MRDDLHRHVFGGQLHLPFELLKGSGTGKGLDVTTNGTTKVMDHANYTGAAYVLISHGDDNYGAINSAGVYVSSPVRGVSDTPTLENNNTALTLTVPSSSPYQPLNSIIDATFSDANFCNLFRRHNHSTLRAFGHQPSPAWPAEPLMFKPLRAYRGSMIFAIVLVLMTLAIIVLAVKAGSVITGIGQRFTGAQGTMTR